MMDRPTDKQTDWQQTAAEHCLQNAVDNFAALMHRNKKHKCLAKNARN